jgi:H+-translocating NAD(P) transhydrogenase subunit alpha
MRIGIPSEERLGETRVALTPNLVPLLLKDGHEIVVEAGAGVRAHFPDVAYANAGAWLVDDALAVYQQADAIFRVQPLDRHPTTGQHEAEMMREAAICIGLLAPLSHPKVMAILAHRRITAYALELIPRISRAQGMDALTSMATVAGYKAVVLAANRLGKMFPLLMTAAGTVVPAKVLVLGAGVAGLQAIATAKRLGARITAFDPRSAVREQVQSLGASFLEMEETENVETAGGYAREQFDVFLQREQATIAEQLPEVDVVISAAHVFGKRAPILVTAEMLARMRPGSVLVDLAAEQGGNCELTQADQEIVHSGVTIIGAGNLPAQVPTDASQLYAHNVVNLFRYLYPRDGNGLDATDDIVREACVTRDGAIVNAAVRAAAEAAEAVQQEVPA